ncbi:MAG TPA: hypothetical protein VIC53_03370 [Wenzhouxiangella sp.]
MSDSISPNPVSDKKPKASRLRAFIKGGLAVVVLAVLAVGAGSYYLSFPFEWPKDLFSAQKSALEQRVIELEKATQSDVMDRRIEQRTGQALEAFSSAQSESQAQWQSQTQEKLEALSKDIERLKAAIEGVSSTVSATQEADRSQASRLDELGEELATVRVSTQDLASRLNQAVSGIEANQAGSVTEESVRAFVATRTQLMEAYWAVLEIEGHMQRQSKGRALTAYEALIAQWSRSNNQELSALLPMLRQAQESVVAWSPTDWGRWQTRIQDWLVEHKRWSFSHANPASAKEVQTNDSTTQAPGVSEGWMSRVGQVLAGVVRIRPRNVAALSAGDQRVARANIEQRLLLLQMAVASRDVSGTRAQSAQLVSEIERLFDLEQTQEVLNQLARLANIEASPPPDSISGVKRAIEQALSQP